MLFSLQLEDGSWGNAETIAPTESSRYHAATVAAMAAATAPKWIEQVEDNELRVGFDKVKHYLPMLTIMVVTLVVKTSLVSQTPSSVPARMLISSCTHIEGTSSL